MFQMTLVVSSPSQCAAASPPDSSASPQPCVGCQQLQTEMKQNMDQMLSKINELHRRMDAFIATNSGKKKFSGLTNQGNQQINKMMNGSQNGHSTPSATATVNFTNSMPSYPTLCSELSSLVENLSDEKPSALLEGLNNSNASSTERTSPAGSQTSASNNGNQGSRKRKPTKEAVQRLWEPQNDIFAAAANGDLLKALKKETNEPSSPAGTPPVSAASNASDNIFQLPTNFMMGDLAQQQQLTMQLLAMVPSLGGNQENGNGQNGQTQTPSDPQALIEQFHAQFKEKMDDDEGNASVSRCTNCMTTKTTAWRRDVLGKLVCNACGLYFRLHRTHRPVHMRKDFIQQRFRRKMKEEEMQSQSAMLSQLMNAMGNPAAGQAVGGTGTAQTVQGNNPFAVSFVEQINAMNQAVAAAQEQLNNTAPV
ncbi:hypothetical protein WR25_03279 isoform A [Diploscapter pachys]|uniref:GATA-type domain-containing protein n=1 Tax=Diploscapter pachys TaxID=2018661 RepID=A0A2A2JQE1_9BILA|nr:hypothetical protein WR25_03279 isoform A [Diploscapter pachys]